MWCSSTPAALDLPFWTGMTTIKNYWSVSNRNFTQTNTYFAFPFDDVLPLSSLTTYPPAYDRMIEANGPVLTQVRNLGEDESDFGGGNPESVMCVPIYREVKKEQHDTNSIVATITSLLPWDRYFIDLLPEGIDGIVLVVSNTCNQDGRRSSNC